MSANPPADPQDNALLVTSRAQWRAWLEANHQRMQGLWLTIAKKGHADHVPSAALVEEALCFGWIDSLPRALDASHSQLWLAPRKRGSAWSRLNRDRAEAMIAAGKMTPSGQQKIDQAKADGSWDFLHDVQAGIVPDDLAAALAQDKGAEANFAAFAPSSKRIILEWIKMAKTPATRLKRITETVSSAAQNIKANHYRQ